MHTIVIETQSHYNPYRHVFRNKTCEKVAFKTLASLTASTQIAMSKEPEPNRSEDTSLPNAPLRRLQGVGSIPKIISFAELCRCGDEVWIENDGAIYRLRRTRQGKLILTK